MCMFEKKIASYSLLTRKNLYKKNCTSIYTHDLEVNTYLDLWKKHTSIDTLLKQRVLLGNLRIIKCNTNIQKKHNP